MARYTGPDCRLCRREGVKLMLKGSRCYTPKCAVERRENPPGATAGRRMRGKTTEYGLQLREKQKTRRIYGVLEAQFRLTFQQASRMHGVTGENLIQLLERRLDNVVYRLGFASSRDQARQLVRHGHIKVNGRRVNIPSYQVRVDDLVAVVERSWKNPNILSAVDISEGAGIPLWAERNRETMSGRLLRLPTREEVALPVQDQLIVELYSK